MKAKSPSKIQEKMTLTKSNFHSVDLNHSLSNSYLTSSYIILKDGSKKRKRNINSYMEEFLEKRRMAAEFAQSKRSTSTKNYRVALDKDFNMNNINIKKIEESININNLKNNLPGKTKPLIDNRSDNNNIKNLIINNENINNNYYINRQNNYHMIHNKYNNFKRHNIVYTKKNNLSQNNNNNISNHSFTENRYSSVNEEQCNIINTNIKDNKEINKNDDISPIKENHIILNAKGGIDINNTDPNVNKENNNNIIKDNNNNEHFLAIMEKMINIDINHSQPSSNIQKIEKFEINNNKKYKDYEKYLNKSESLSLNIINKNNDNNNNNEKNDTEENKENEKENDSNNIITRNNHNIKKQDLDFSTNTNTNKNTTNQETFSVISNEQKEKMNDININNINKISEEYIVEENEEKQISIEKEEENEEEKSINRINEDENEKENEEEENEENERCEVLKGDVDKSKYLKGKNNVITEEIEEVEEANENTLEFQTNKSGRNKNNNRLNNDLEINNNIKNEKEESIRLVKEEKKYNNLNKIEIKEFKKNKNTNKEKDNNNNKNYNFVFSNNNTNEINNISNDNKINNNIHIENNNNLDDNNDISNTNENNNIVNISDSNNKEKDEDNNNDEINTEMMNNNINTPNKINYFNFETNNKEKEDYINIFNQDIERLEKIRNNNNQEAKEEDSYLNEIDNFISLIREKRKSININNNVNDIFDTNYKNKENYIPPKNILELKKIYNNLSYKNNNNNINTIKDSNNNNNIIQKINYNKMKLPISKSTSLQSLLNNLKKERNYNYNTNTEYYTNNFFTEKINKEINESNNSEEDNNQFESNNENDFKLFDETLFKKIKDNNLRKKNKFRNEFKFKDYETNKNLSHLYLDKVKEDLLMNISANKILNKNDINIKNWNIKKIVYSNPNNNEIDDSEIMPANNMKSLYINKF